MAEVSRNLVPKFGLTHAFQCRRPEHPGPFACGGVYYGNQVTTYGVNYGGGIKFKPTDLTNPSGRLSQVELSVGASYNF